MKYFTDFNRFLTYRHFLHLYRKTNSCTFCHIPKCCKNPPSPIGCIADTPFRPAISIALSLKISSLISSNLFKNPGANRSARAAPSSRMIRKVPSIPIHLTRTISSPAFADLLASSCSFCLTVCCYMNNTRLDPIYTLRICKENPETFFFTYLRNLHHHRFQSGLIGKRREHDPTLIPYARAPLEAS